MLRDHARNIFAAGVLMLAGTVNVSAELNATQAFTDAPDRIIPLLNRSTRLDMLDYFNSGSQHASKNAMNGQSKITELTPGHLVVSLTPASSCEIAVIPAGNDTLIAMVNTVDTPAPDSKLKIYTSDWSQDITDKVFTAPELTDWLTDEGRKNIGEIETMIPFMLSSGSFSEDGLTYRLTNNISQFLTPEVYNPISSYFKPALTYKWNGKRLTPQ